MEVVAAEINGASLKRKNKSKEDLLSRSPIPAEKVSRKSGSPFRLQNGHKENNGSAHSGDTTEEEDDNSVNMSMNNTTSTDNGDHTARNNKLRNCTNGKHAMDDEDSDDQIFFPYQKPRSKIDLEMTLEKQKQIIELKQILRNEENKLVLLRKLQQSQLQPVPTTNATTPTICSNKENKDKTRPSSPTVLANDSVLQLTNKAMVADKKRNSISKESSPSDKRQSTNLSNMPASNGSLKQDHASLQQRQAAAKLALRKQLEKSLLSIPPPKAPPPEMHFVPNGNSAEFICLLGLETVVTFLKEGYETNKGSPPAPFVCVQCKGDFTPVWKWQHADTSSKNKSPSVICENCVSQNMKRALKAEHTNRLKSAFVKALQQEQELEAQMAMGVSPPPSLQMPSPSPSPKPHSLSSQQQQLQQLQLQQQQLQQQQQNSLSNSMHRTSSPLSSAANLSHGSHAGAPSSGSRHHSSSPHHSRSSTSSSLQEQQNAAAVMAAAAASMQNSLLAGGLGSLMGLGNMTGSQSLPSTSRGQKGKTKSSSSSSSQSSMAGMQNSFASQLSKLSAAQQQAVLQAQAQQFLQHLMSAAAQPSRSNTSNQQAAATAAALMNPLMNPLLQAYSLSLLQNSNAAAGSSGMTQAAASSSGSSHNNAGSSSGPSPSSSSIPKSVAADLQRQYLLDMIPPSSRSSSWK